MNLASLATTTIHGSHISALIAGSLFLAAMVAVIVRQLQASLEEAGLVLPRRFTLALVLAIMVLVMLRIAFPGATALAFRR